MQLTPVATIPKGKLNKPNPSEMQASPTICKIVANN
jgi:hypothetical protein